MKILNNPNDPKKTDSSYLPQMKSNPNKYERSYIDAQDWASFEREREEKRERKTERERDSVILGGH